MIEDNKKKEEASFPPIDTEGLYPLLLKSFGIDTVTNLITDDKLEHIAKHPSLVGKSNLYNFIFEVVSTIKPNSVFDPWLTLASPSFLLPQKTLKGFAPLMNDWDLLEKFKDTDSLSFKKGLPQFPFTSQFDEKFDLVLTLPPLVMKIPKEYINDGVKDYSTRLILESKKIIKDNGSILIVVAPNFFNQEDGIRAINKNGLCIKAAFAIPRSTFYPTTNLGAYLLLAQNGPQKDIFVSETPSNIDSSKIIVGNFIKSIKGKQPQLGAIVSLEDFKSMESFIADEEMREIGARTGFSPVSFYTLVKEMKRVNVNDWNDIEGNPNTVFLPYNLSQNATNSPADCKIAPRNYLQILVDETRVSALYLAKYMNSSIGQKWRRSISVGTVIPQFSIELIKKSIIYLPDLSTQHDVIAVDSRISQIAIKLDEMKRSLWRQPKKHGALGKELKGLFGEQKLENWIDTLPFPISSILWRYYATNDKAKVIEHLFHFFEAFSEFMSMIMVSAFKQDINFYHSESHNWLGNNPRFKDWHLKATFGSWNVLSSNLAKATRTYLNNKDTVDLCRELYGNPNDAFLNILCSKEIINILTEVAELRNQWKGHGGISNEAENRQRALTLENYLLELRKIIADGFEDVKIIAPNTGTYEDGLFTFNTKELVGARTPFNEISIVSSIALSKKKLYLYHIGQSKPVELLPFIKYVEHSNAVYFYSRVESSGVRWVSYHFETESELVEPQDQEIIKAFELLKMK